MSKFQHSSLGVLIQDVNPRNENHGDQDVLAVDWKATPLSRVPIANSLVSK